MFQFSVYMRLCNGLEMVRKHETQLKHNLPPRGSVRTICITEKQFMKMGSYLGTQTSHEKYISDSQLVLL